MRRLLSRALLVVGGAVAGTAAAWALSSGAASAESLPVGQPAPADAVTSAVQDAAKPLVKPLPDAFGELADTTEAASGTAPRLMPESPAKAPKFDEVAGQLKSAFSQFADRLRNQNTEAVSKDPVSLVDWIGHQAPRSPDAGTQPAATPPQSEQSVAPVVTVYGPVAPLRSGESILGDAGQAERGMSRSAYAPGSPSDPVRLPMAPLSPVNMPAPCNCGQDGPGSAGGSTLGEQSLFGTSFGTALVDALTSSDERVSPLPGKQPGTTPD